MVNADEIDTIPFNLAKSGRQGASLRFRDLESLFSRLAGLQMLVLTGLRGVSAPMDAAFLFERLLIDASSLVPEKHAALTAIRERVQQLVKFRDADQRLNVARGIISDIADILSKADTRSFDRGGPHRFGLKWIVVAFVLLAVLGSRLAYRPVFLGRFIFTNYNQRMNDLSSIKTALQNYRTQMGQYPLSVEAGKSWSGIEWSAPQGSDWLPGLVPTFIDNLPHDPRNNQNPYNQYVYKSNGIDFKLLSLVPEDCEFAISNQPSLSDPARNVYQQCYAYGYWTSGAGSW